MQSNSVILARNINHFYGTGKLQKQILYDISIDIKVGEIIIMNGPSGSGKTTLLTLMGGLRSVQSGSLKILEHELYKATNKQFEQLRKQIGFIFQSHNLLYSLTASQNVQMSIALHKHLSRQEVIYKSQQILEAVGLGDYINAYPNQLSGGQKQRVAIARALVSKPLLILADEPTSALDKKTGRDVVELIQQLAKKQGCAILIVTHNNRMSALLRGRKTIYSPPY